jgi:hypothetical protein
MTTSFDIATTLRQSWPSNMVRADEIDTVSALIAFENKDAPLDDAALMAALAEYKACPSLFPQRN